MYAEDAPELDPGVFDLDIPVFGICYGFQAMAAKLGGEVANTGGREFGRTTLTVNGEGILHQGLSDTQPVWMSHNDAVQQAPEASPSPVRRRVRPSRRSRTSSAAWPASSTTPRCCTPRTVSRS